MPHFLELALTWSDVGSALRLVVPAVLGVLGTLAVQYVRRPRLKLAADRDLTWTRIESDGCVYVRLVVTCSGWTKGATGTRVMVERCWRPGDERPRTLGGPTSLGWPSAQDGVDGSVTVHPDTPRAIDLGALTRGPHRAGLVYGVGGGALDGQDARWHLHLGLAGGLAITDGRDVLEPTDWTIGLLVVADDSQTRRYDVSVSWDGDAHDAQDVLDTLSVSVKPR